jgi:predicted small lipoprotein YifL
VRRLILAPLVAMLAADLAACGYQPDNRRST